jgi:ABC-type lipoprotein export system ATPase subunit
VNDPALILADEPTGNLDTVTAENIFQLFQRLVDAGKTVVVVTHDSNLAARFSRTIHISDGEIVSASANGNGNRNTPGTTPVEIHVPIEPGETGASLAQAGDGNRGEGSPTDEAHQPAISLNQVVKTYVNAAGSFTALKGVNLQMNYGQFVSIVGKSGSGKSTLLNVLTGIDHPTSGQVIIGGQDLYKMSESKRALWRGRNVGIVFQFFQLLPTLTLLEKPCCRWIIATCSRPTSAQGAPWSCLKWSAWVSRPTSCLRWSPAGSSKARLSPAPWRPTRRLSWLMSQPETWTHAQRRRSSACFRGWPTRARPS